MEKNQFRSFRGAKSKAREIAKFMGIRKPEVFYKAPFRAFPGGKLSQEFVLKPSFASTSIGVDLGVLDGDSFRLAVSNESVTKSRF